jgi:hypothetical protein
VVLEEPVNVAVTMGAVVSPTIVVVTVRGLALRDVVSPSVVGQGQIKTQHRVMG